MKRVVRLLGIACAIAASGLCAAEPSQPAEATVDGEVKVGAHFFFIPAGENYGERGLLGKVLAVDGKWVKIEELISVSKPRRMWINRDQVGAIWQGDETAVKHAENARDKPGVREEGSPDGNAEIRKLLEERLVVVTRTYELMRAAFERGEASLETVLNAQRQMLESRLELCPTKAERIAVHKELVQVAQQLVDAMTHLVQSHEATQSQLLAAQANQLSARIELLRAQQGE